MVDLWHLNNINWLKELTPESAATLRASSMLLSFEPGEVVEDLVLRSARSRLARMMLELAEDFSKPNGMGTLIDLQLTHAELATLVGSIALGEFEDEELITCNAGKIVILNHSETCKKRRRKPVRRR